MNATKFFKNSNELECPIESCKLFNSDCKTEYNGGGAPPVSMYKTKTTLNLWNDKPEGYKLNLCIECTNGA